MLAALLAAACRGETAPEELTSDAHAATAAESPGDGVRPATSTTAVAANPTAPGPLAPEGMVEIPAGIFLMGSDRLRGDPEEKPPHEAIVAAFFLDSTEVSVGAYGRCVEAGGCTTAHDDNPFCNVLSKDKDLHPINCVDLHQAAAFCAWAGKRLPTEREWEYAASGGRERRPFSWGQDDPSAERSCYDHPGGTCPRASFAAGAFGLHDMTGNVWEWTASKFQPYPSQPGPDAIEAGALYVYRGGSWSRRFRRWMLAVVRNRYTADQQSASIGIRCAKSIAPLQCPADTEARGQQCVRVRGEISCEPLYRHDGSRCVPDPNADDSGTAAPSASVDASQLGVPQAGTDATPVTASITRTRTAQHDSDCQRHWPRTPAAYLFKGGPSFAARKPSVAAAGCVPRDMGTSWTSACCP